LNFYDRLQTEVKSYKEAVGDYQEQLAQAQKEVERLAAEGSKDEEPDLVQVEKAAALVQRSDELGKRAQQMLEHVRHLPFYTQDSFRQFVNTVVVKAATRGIIVKEELTPYVEGEDGSWWYEIRGDLSVRIRRASQFIAWYPWVIVWGPYQKIFETREEFETRFEKEFLKGLEWTARMQPPDEAAVKKRIEEGMASQHPGYQ
jgi:hypothetical protein